jgi:hypothetical protein
MFVSKVESEMGPPNISGGTTINPDAIVTLYWPVKGINKTRGVYIDFLGDHTSNVIWNELDGSTRKLTGISREELSNLDIPGKFRHLNRRLSKTNAAPAL